MIFKNERQQDKAERAFRKAHGIYKVFNTVSNGLSNWEDIEGEFCKHNSVAITSIGEWCVVSKDHLTRKEQKELLEILEADIED